MEKDALDRLKDKLDETHTWPCIYTFKFIIAKDRAAKVTALFGDSPYTVRESNKGRYVCVTADMVMPDSAAVVTVYRRALKIEGIISL